MTEIKGNRFIKVDPKIHKEFKIYATKKDTNMKDLLDEILIEKMESDPIE